MHVYGFTERFDGSTLPTRLYTDGSDKLVKLRCKSTNLPSNKLAVAKVVKSGRIEWPEKVFDVQRFFKAAV